MDSKEKRNQLDACTHETDIWANIWKEIQELFEKVHDDIWTIIQPYTNSDDFNKASREIKQLLVQIKFKVKLIEKITEDLDWI